MAQTKAVLVHGAGGGAWEWEKWQEELKELDELEVVAISLDPVKDNLAATRLDDYYQQVKQAADGHHDTVLIGATSFLVNVAAVGILVAACEPTRGQLRNHTRGPFVMFCHPCLLAGAHQH
eukprot:757994-Hanusia_phi.AAC.3